MATALGLYAFALVLAMMGFVMFWDSRRQQHKRSTVRRMDDPAKNENEYTIAKLEMTRPNAVVLIFTMFASAAHSDEAYEDESYYGAQQAINSALDVLGVSDAEMTEAVETFNAMQAEMKDIVEGKKRPDL